MHGLKQDKIERAKPKGCVDSRDRSEVGAMLREPPIPPPYLPPESRGGEGLRRMAQDASLHWENFGLKRRATVDTAAGVLKRDPAPHYSVAWGGESDCGRVEPTPVTQHILGGASSKLHIKGERWGMPISAIECDCGGVRGGIDKFVTADMRRKRRCTEKIPIPEFRRYQGYDLWGTDCYPDWLFEREHIHGPDAGSVPSCDGTRHAWPYQSALLLLPIGLRAIPAVHTVRLTSGADPNRFGSSRSGDEAHMRKDNRMACVADPPGFENRFQFEGHRCAGERRVVDRSSGREALSRAPDCDTAESQKWGRGCQAGTSQRISWVVWRPIQVRDKEGDADYAVTQHWRGRKHLCRPNYEPTEPTECPEQWGDLRFRKEHVADRRGICNQ
jgi:hypothetical protein